MLQRQPIGQLLSKPFLLFSAIMILKLILVWSVVFNGNGSSLWLMLATGIPSVWFLFCLTESFLYRRKLGFYLLFDLLLTCVFFAVIMYYKYFGVIVTYHQLRQVNQVSEVNGSVFSLLHPYYLFIFSDIVLLALFLITSRKARSWGRRLAVREGRGLYAAGLVLTLAVCTASVLPHKDSMNEFMQAEGMGIVNYEAYVAFAPSKNVEVLPDEITQPGINKLKGIEESANPLFRGAAKGKNVIIIQLEAFQNFLLDKKIDGTEITPHMNALKREHYYFPNFFQQVGQGNTADAEFVVNTSFYIPPDGAASDIYADKALPSMPETFAENGYKTATFHTNNVKFWNRDKLYKALGWQSYYDDSYFGNSDPVMFAASDEVLYDKTADKLIEMQKSGKPFYAQVIAMSAHHPFDIPASKFKMTLPERFEGTLVGDYIRAQNYADFALGQFIEKLKASGLWEDSVVVLYGDHQGLPIYSLDDREKKLMEEIYGREYGITDMLNIPLIISVPGSRAQTFPQIGGQSDIYPTVANLVGISLDDRIHFGQDMFNQTFNLLPERYYLPSGSLITGSGAFVPGTGYEDGRSYPFGGEQPSAPAATEDEYMRAHKLISMSDSYVQSLPEWASN